MKVREVVICLGCDEIYEQYRAACPVCMDTKSIKLRAYLPPLDGYMKDYRGGEYREGVRVG